MAATDRTAKRQAPKQSAPKNPTSQPRKQVAKKKQAMKKVSPVGKKRSILYKSRHNIGNRTAAERVGSYRENETAVVYPEGFWDPVPVEDHEPSKTNNNPIKPPQKSSPKVSSASVPVSSQPNKAVNRSPVKRKHTDSETKLKSASSSPSKNAKSHELESKKASSNIKSGKTVTDKKNENRLGRKGEKSTKTENSKTGSQGKKNSVLPKKPVGKKGSKVRAPRIQRTACLNASAIMHLIYENDEPDAKRSKFAYNEEYDFSSEESEEAFEDEEDDYEESDNSDSEETESDESEEESEQEEDEGKVETQKDNRKQDKKPEKKQKDKTHIIKDKTSKDKSASTAKEKTITPKDKTSSGQEKKIANKDKSPKKDKTSSPKKEKVSTNKDKSGPINKDKKKLKGFSESKDKKVQYKEKKDSKDSSKSSCDKKKVKKVNQEEKNKSGKLSEASGKNCSDKEKKSKKDKLDEKKKKKKKKKKKLIKTEKDEDGVRKRKSSTEDVPLWPPPKRMASLNASAILAATQESRAYNKEKAARLVVYSPKKSTETSPRAKEIKDTKQSPIKTADNCAYWVNGHGEEIISKKKEGGCSLIKLEEKYNKEDTSNEDAIIHVAQTPVPAPSPDVQIIEVKAAPVTPPAQVVPPVPQSHSYTGNAAEPSPIQRLSQLQPPGFQPVQSATSPPPAQPQRNRHMYGPDMVRAYAPQHSQRQPPGQHYNYYASDMMGPHHHQPTPQQHNYPPPPRHQHPSHPHQQPHPQQGIMPTPHPHLPANQHQNIHPSQHQMAPPHNQHHHQSSDSSLHQQHHLPPNHPATTQSQQHPSSANLKPKVDPNLYPLPGSRMQVLPGMPASQMHGIGPSSNHHHQQQSQQQQQPSQQQQSSQQQQQPQQPLHPTSSSSSTYTDPHGYVHRSSPMGNTCTYPYPHSNAGLGPPASHCGMYPVGGPPGGIGHHSSYHHMGCHRPGYSSAFSVPSYNHHSHNPYDYYQPPPGPPQQGTPPSGGGMMQGMGDTCCMPHPMSLHVHQPSVKVLVHNSGGLASPGPGYNHKDLKPIIAKPIPSPSPRMMCLQPDKHESKGVIGYTGGRKNDPVKSDPSQRCRSGESQQDEYQHTNHGGKTYTMLHSPTSSSGSYSLPHTRSPAKSPISLPTRSPSRTPGKSPSRSSEGSQGEFGKKVSKTLEESKNPDKHVAKEQLSDSSKSNPGNKTDSSVSQAPHGGDDKSKSSPNPRPESKKEGSNGAKLKDTKGNPHEGKNVSATSEQKSTPDKTDPLSIKVGPTSPLKIDVGSPDSRPSLTPPSGRSSRTSPGSKSGKVSPVKVDRTVYGLRPERKSTDSGSGKSEQSSPTVRSELASPCVRIERTSSGSLQGKTSPGSVASERNCPSAKSDRSSPGSRSDRSSPGCRSDRSSTSVRSERSRSSPGVKSDRTSTGPGTKSSTKSDKQSSSGTRSERSSPAVRSGSRSCQVSPGTRSYRISGSRSEPPSPSLHTDRTSPGLKHKLAMRLEEEGSAKQKQWDQKHSYKKEANPRVKKEEQSKSKSTTSEQRNRKEDSSTAKKESSVRKFEKDKSPDAPVKRGTKRGSDSGGKGEGSGGAPGGAVAGGGKRVGMVPPPAPLGPHSWKWEGDSLMKKVFVPIDAPPVERKCYPAVRHLDGDVIQERDCVLVKSGPRKKDIPFVAKIAALWENGKTGDMMMSVLWYYRPEHTESERLPHFAPSEIFASKHRDETSVACIDDRCYILTYNEYCRYRAELKRVLEGCAPRPHVVPELEPGQVNRRHLPPLDADPETVFLCRRVYDFKLKRVLKNPT